MEVESSEEVIQSDIPVETENTSLQDDPSISLTEDMMNSNTVDPSESNTIDRQEEESPLPEQESLIETPKVCCSIFRLL